MSKDKDFEINNLPQEEENNIEKQENDQKTKDKKGKKINVKHTALVILVAVAFAGVGFYGGKAVGRNLPATHKTYPKSKVIATVGKTKITGDDLNKRMEPLYYNNGLKKMSNEEIETYEVNTLNYMTNLESLYQMAKDEKVTITDDEANSNYESTMSSIESTYNLTEEEFLKKFGLTKEYVMESLKKELIATKYLSQNSEVSEKEAKNYYNKNKEDFFEISASHILISNYDEAGNEVSDKQKAKNKEKAEKILKRVQNGESFDDLALENSDDTYTSSDGGDLGFFHKGKMEENFENAVFSLKNGEIYPEVVETSYGYHIIKKTGEQYAEFDDVKDSLVESLAGDKQSTLLKNAQEKYDVKLNI